MRSCALRLGDLVDDGAAPVSISALYQKDAVQAVEKALTADISEGYADSRTFWAVFHIQSDVPKPQVPDHHCRDSASGSVLQANANHDQDLFILGSSFMLSFALSLSKGHSFMVRQAHHERATPLTFESERALQSR